MDLIVKEEAEGGVDSVLFALKPGFYSKSTEVV
jgi:hypothetical protein